MMEQAVNLVAGISLCILLLGLALYFFLGVLTVWKSSRKRKGRHLR
jgi:hypothetical protein